jgi:drug/metabolite transporter (DMT)-like permease
MEKTRLAQKNLRNSVTQERHRKEVFLQVTIPVIIFSLVTLALAVITIYPATAEQDSRWADISVVFLLVPVIFMALISLFILAVSVYATVYFIKVLPPFFFRVYQWLYLVNNRVQLIGEFITKPFIRINAWMASANKMRESIRRIK